MPRVDQARRSRASSSNGGVVATWARTISRSRRPRAWNSHHRTGMSRGSSTMKTSTERSGSSACGTLSSMADDPSHRTVVFAPSNGMPSCNQRSRRWPLRTLTCVPTANQPRKIRTARTNTVRPSSLDIGSVRPVDSPRATMDEKSARRRGLREMFRDFLYGLSGLEFERQALEMRGSLETIFFATTLGDMLGLPIIPPIYSLRVLPYAVPHIATWKRRVLREREFSDSEEFHLHGV